MSTTVRYSVELKKKVIELSTLTTMTAEEIVEKVQTMRRFKAEAKALTANSVYSIRQRCTDIDVLPTAPEPKEDFDIDVSRPVVDECLVTAHGENTTLTLSVPTKRIGLVLRRLGY